MKRLRARLSTYLGGEALLPLAVLFGLTWADQVDTQTFNVLGPEIADDFALVEVPDDAVDEVIARVNASTIAGKKRTIRRERFSR